MKKLSVVIIALIICFSYVVPSSADAAAPAFREYDAYVTSPDGYTYTDDYSGEKIFIPYNAEITVTGEYDGLAYGTYNNRYISISLDGLSKVKSEVDISEAVKLEHPVTYVVMSENGAKIRKGPAESYDEIGTIPCDTEITVTYGTEEYTDYLPWAYCTYGDVSGWIHVEEHEMCYDFARKLTKESGKTGRIIVLRDGLKLTDKPCSAADIEYSQDENAEEEIKLYSENSAQYITGTIPAGTEFKYSTYYDDTNRFYALVEFDGIHGWLESGDNYNGLYSSYATDDHIESLFIYDGSADIYSDSFGKGEKLGTIPENNAVLSYLSGSELMQKSDGSMISEFDYENNEYREDDVEYFNTYYVEYNGIKGWMTSEDGTGFDTFPLEYSDRIKFTADTDAFSDRTLSEKLCVIPAEAEAFRLFEADEGGKESDAVLYDGDLVYITAHGNYELTGSGYAQTDDVEIMLYGKPLETDYSIVNIGNSDTDSDPEETAEAETQDNQKQSKGVQSFGLVILAAVIIGIDFAAVIILRIMEKKQK